MDTHTHLKYVRAHFATAISFGTSVIKNGENVHDREARQMPEVME